MGAQSPSLFNTARLRWCLQNKFSADFDPDPSEQNPSFDVDRTLDTFTESGVTVPFWSKRA